MSNQDYLISVYEDTVKKCIRGKFSKLDVEESEKHTFMKDFGTPNPIFDKMEIEVINCDTLIVADKYKNENLCILNMASKYVPGGGVAKGAPAQEEELFRRTNYFKTLTRKFYEINHPDIIYSPKVWIIKDDEYEDLENPWSSPFIAAPLLRHPYLQPNDTYYEEDKITVRRIIEHIFAIAYMYDHEVLILGAIGCGAYKNPPLEVIEIFNEMLEKYNKCFKKVVFAVYSKTPNDKNYKLFNKYIIKSFN